MNDMINMNTLFFILTDKLCVQYLTSFGDILTKQMNYLLSSLCILDGYIYPYRLSSIVQIYSDNETRLTVIIDIDKNAHDSNSIDVLPYLI